MSSTMNLDIDNLVIDGVASEPEYELLPAGVYECVIDKLEPFHGTTKAGEAETSLKVIFRVATGDWADETLSTIISLIRTDKEGHIIRDSNGKPVMKDITFETSGLHKLWKGAMNETPVEGGRYAIASLKGRRLNVVVEHKPNKKGQIWPRPAGYSPIVQGTRRRGAAPAVAVIEDDFDDDLKNA